MTMFAPVGRVRGAGESVRGPGPCGELGVGAVGGTGALLEGSPIGRRAAVEQRGLMAGGAEHPHQASRDDAAGVVVRHDDGVIADPAPRHPPGERLGIGQRVAADGWPACTGQPELEIDEDGARKVAALIGGATGAPVQVPPDVGQDDIAVGLMSVPPFQIDHGRDHRVRVPLSLPVVAGVREEVTMSRSSGV